ncbi:unnamed protein product [Phytophthora fragariaefolia]|uniref:Unnamed protein product n=1 Tax=Phytophthora fragariaefolia TaxID=1490495 RepID=A0A9W6YAA3_9STRA|nr:unnamed protein product [Phytophthora fragariaefolia]
MRFNAFLLVVVVTLAVCCHGLTLANADNAARKNTVSARIAPALRKLEDTAAIDAEEEERGFDKLRTLFDNLPFLSKLKGLAGKSTDVNKVKAAAEKSPEVSKLKAAVGGNPIKLTYKDAKKMLEEAKKKHPAIGVMMSVLKMLAVVGVIAFTTGFIVYIHENYF